MKSASCSTTTGFPGDDTPIIKGSARRAQPQPTPTLQNISPSFELMQAVDDLSLFANWTNPS